MINNITESNISIKTLINVFSVISTHSADVYWIASPDFKRCLYVSHSYEDISGYKRDALLRDVRSWDKLLLPADLKNYHPLAEMVKEIRLDKVPKTYEEKYRIITQEGEIKWLEDQGQSLYSNNGEYIGICGVARDITYEKIIQQLSIPLLNIPENSMARFYLKGKYKNVYLTTREAECAFYLLKGKTSKDIGKILNISYRTVEDHLQRIKNKLNLRHKSEVIIALIDSNFIQIFE